MNFIKKKFEEFLNTFFEKKVSESLSKQLDPILNQLNLINGYNRRLGKHFTLYGHHGVLENTSNLSDTDKLDHLLWWQFYEKAQCALAAALFYPGGDYLEFGSAGMATFRNFLSAFHLNKLDKKFPDTRFHAFDIFGNIDLTDRNEEEKEYFKDWKEQNAVNEAYDWINQHNLFIDKCEVHPGLFQDTLPSLLSRYMDEDTNKKVGFAFLDCNITTSYKYVFEQLPPVMHPLGYIYMDEYHINPDVPYLFRKFIDKLKETRAILGAEHIRNAGSFGALFRLHTMNGYSRL